MDQSFPVASEASLLAAAIATALCEKLTLQEQNIWGNLFTSIGASMLSIAAINQSLSSSHSSSTE